jgi:hypothetical protein
MDTKRGHVPNVGNSAITPITRAVDRLADKDPEQRNFAETIAFIND